MWGKLQNSSSRSLEIVWNVTSYWRPVESGLEERTIFRPETNGKGIPHLTAPLFLHPLPTAQNKMSDIITSSPSRSTARTVVAVAPPSGSTTIGAQNSFPLRALERSRSSSDIPLASSTHLLADVCGTRKEMRGSTHEYFSQTSCVNCSLLFTI